MATSLKALAVSTLLAAGMTCRVGAASAAPVIDHLAFTNAVPSTIEFAQWRGGWGWGAPAAGGFVAGALLGGALAAPYYYPPGPYYYLGQASSSVPVIAPSATAQSQMHASKL